MDQEVAATSELGWTGERLVASVEGDVAFEHLHRYALAREMARGRVVLDIACGEGYGSNLMAQVADQVIGVDLSPEAIDHARRAYVRNNLKFEVGDCSKIPVAAASVDLVVSFETLEHTDQHQEMLAEIKRALRPDGVLIISTPDKRVYSDVPGYENPFHTKELYLDEFETLLKTFFKNCLLFGQRICHGSLIVPIRNMLTGFTTFRGNFSDVEGEPGLSQSVYLIAIASDGEDLPIVHPGLFQGKEIMMNQDLMVKERLEESFKGIESMRQHAQSLQSELTGRDAAVVELQVQLKEQTSLAERAANEIVQRDAAITSLQGEIESSRSNLEALQQSFGAQLERLTAAVERNASRQDVFQTMVLEVRERFLQRDENIQAVLNDLNKHIRYQSLISRIRNAVSATLPADASIIVISRGDDQLLELAGRQAGHFPQTEAGVYAGHYPANSIEAITHLEALRSKGNRFLLIPQTALWWLDHYAELKKHLESCYQVLFRADACLIFDLRKSSTPALLTKGKRKIKTTRKALGRKSAITTERPELNLLQYYELKDRIKIVSKSLPPDATVIVVSKGDDEFLRLEGRTAWHFPQLENGEYAGYYPADSAEAIASLEVLRAKGAEFLLFPWISLWWLEHYAEFCQHIESQYQVVVCEEDTCVIFRLQAPSADTPESKQAQLLYERLLHGPVGGSAPVELHPQPAKTIESSWTVPDQHPAFDPNFYTRTYPDAVIGSQNPLQHYLTKGWRKGYKPNPKFDPLFYLSTYPDIAEAGVEPLTHFITWGLKEGRVGCPEDISFMSFEADYNIPHEPIASNSTLRPDVKAIAFYLPQFHPIPENDEWWGEGFTEWTNVRRAKPQFKGHYQPHVPSDLGYYDLREPEVLERQTQLARDYGIYGFCFHYYWFAGKNLLDLPVRRLLETGKPDFPFCISWANENWTRRWDGAENEILIAQQHSPEDDLAFIHNVESILLHRNYIKIDGKPLLLVYRPSLLPDAKATAGRWRAYFQDRGYGDIYLVSARTFKNTAPAEEYGFDASVQFPPHGANANPLTGMIKGKNKDFRGRIHDYNSVKNRYIEEIYNLNSSERVYPGVMPSWDNTARLRNKSGVWIKASPESYYAWLSTVSDFVRRNNSPAEQMVFINAWNEWAEGCHLEPDQRFGYAWLNATKLATNSDIEQRNSVLGSHEGLKETSKGLPDKDSRPLDILFVSHDAYPAGAQHLLLTLTSWLKEIGLVNPRFLLAGPGRLYEDFLRIGPVLLLDSTLQQGLSDDERKMRILKSFCGEDISAVYLNSAASGHLIELTRQLGVPHIAHVHELETSIQRWAGAEKMSALRDHADLFIAASEPVAENLYTNHRISRGRIEVVDSFIRSTRFRDISDADRRRCKSALGLDPAAKIVLGCGTTDRRKGPDLFVQIAETLRKRYSRSVQFVWVGGEVPEEIRQLEQFSDSKGLKNVVKFAGAVATPFPYMVASDVFLLPSREDPFPLVCLEAADCGLPIICFAEAGGMPDFVGSSCGAVVPYLNISEMADVLNSFLTDDAKARLLGSQARDNVRRHFDVSIKGREIYEILKALCFMSGVDSVHPNGFGKFEENERRLIRELNPAGGV